MSPYIYHSKFPAFISRNIFSLLCVLGTRPIVIPPHSNTPIPKTVGWQHQTNSSSIAQAAELINKLEPQHTQTMPVTSVYIVSVKKRKAYFQTGRITQGAYVAALRGKIWK